MSGTLLVHWLLFFLITTDLVGAAPPCDLAPAPALRDTQAAVADPRLAELDLLIRRMTPEQRIAQLMIVSIDGEKLSETESEILRKLPPGGIVLYRRHLGSEQRAQALTARIAELSSPVRPFIAVDHEHGAVRRLPATDERLPGNMALGATRSADLAREAGIATGVALRRLGVDVNFAPVLDVASNPRSPIGTRSFGDDPELVGRLGAAFIEGQSMAGVASVAKHFVGEGAVAADTHKESAVLADDSGVIVESSLVPFRVAIRAGVPAVMTSHIGAPNLTERGTMPITYSRRAVFGLLREEMGFRGVIITDALGMRGARSYNDVGELALWAFEAGSDMILVSGWPDERSRVFERLNEARRNGRLSDERITESLRRILSMKKRWGRTTTTTGLPPPDIARRIALQALTVWGVAPLPMQDVPQNAVVLEDEEFFAARLGLPRVLATESDNCAIPSNKKNSVRYVLACFATREQAEAAKAWIAHNAADAMVIAIILGDPRDLKYLGRYDTAIGAYSGSPASREVIADYLAKGGSATGVLPVRLQVR